jgi:hypothetical protein
MVLKNDSAWSVLKSFHHFWLTDLLKTGALLVRCPSALLGWFSVIGGLPSPLKKRRIIQRNRKVSQADIECWFKPFDYRAWIKKHFWS